MADSLRTHDKYLLLIKKQKARWVKFSALFISILILITIEWAEIVNLNNPLVWCSLALLLVPITVTWWYWTMQVLLSLIAHRTEEVIILKEIIADLRAVKEDIQELKNNNKQ